MRIGSAGGTHGDWSALEEGVVERCDTPAGETAGRSESVEIGAGGLASVMRREQLEDARSEPVDQPGGLASVES